MLSDLGLLSIEDWIDLFSVGMVFFGVLFGFIQGRRTFPKEQEVPNPAINDLRKRAWESKRKKSEDFWEYVLILGLGIELFMVPRHLKEVTKLKKQILEATERTVKAELDLARFKAPRSQLLRESGFAEFIKSNPGVCGVRILYEKGDPDADGFASALAEALFKAGWKPVDIDVIPDDMVAPVFKNTPKKNWVNLPTMQRAIGSQELIAVFAQKTDDSSLANFLWKTLNKSGFPSLLGPDEKLSANQVLVVIGRKL